MSKLSISNTTIYKANGAKIKEYEDLLVVEEPLEIRIGFGDETHRTEISLAVTMRTPSNDHELVTGLLISEGIIQKREDVISLKYCQSAKHPENIIRATLNYDISFNVEDYKRNMLASSSCGICGKAYIDAIQQRKSTKQQKSVFLNIGIIYQLADKLSSNQNLFTHTGGLHAAALFRSNGDLILSREDIGRHNALDKLIGAMLIKEIDIEDKLIVLSSRLGFEMVQKCLMIGIKTIVAIGAPSSLAVEMAEENEMCMIGFLKSNKFNIYAGEKYIL